LIIWKNKELEQKELDRIDHMEKQYKNTLLDPTPVCEAAKFFL